MLCGDLNDKKIKTRGDKCTNVADSFYCTVDTNSTLYSNYTPIKVNF